MALFVGWISATTFALFELGTFDDMTAARLENLAAPLASANDQLALVTWFQRAAPPAGFGIGAVPWCGYASATGCPGVPAQIQSDYTLTALVGVFGWTAAWALTIGCALWLHRLIRHHGASRTASRGSSWRRGAWSTTTRRSFPGSRSPGSCSRSASSRSPSRQSRGAAAHRRHVSVRELRHDVAGREHGDARPRDQLNRRGRG